MHAPIIQAENLSKIYYIKAAENKIAAAKPSRKELFFALKNMSFQISSGETVGIIGRNGAGKSTLLKILSRITEPTSGRAVIRGRVSSVLEVGTGFHPELTGKENIYLNGAVLGMRKKEIDARLDEIISFSEIERFIETPVKRYSSGMYVRLAFSVAAHLQSEILIVDEALAVGDVLFQRKCLKKIRAMTGEGKTVLLVSHNLMAVQNLCDRVMVIKDGVIAKQGPAEECIAFYLEKDSRVDPDAGSLESSRDKKYKPVIRKAYLIDKAGNATDHIRCGDPITFRIDYDAGINLTDPVFGIAVESMEGFRIFGLHTGHQCAELKELPSAGSIDCHVPEMPLVAGSYYLSFGCSNKGEQIDMLYNAFTLHVYEGDFYGTGSLPKSQHQGQVLVRAQWNFDQARPRKI